MIINQYEYKSNWDRYFETKVNKEGLENNLSELYKYRNLVAHNRKIRMKESSKTEELTTKVEKVLQKCLDKIDDIKVPEEEKENLETISSKILGRDYNRRLDNVSEYATNISLSSLGWTNLSSFNEIINPVIDSRINPENNPAIANLRQQEAIMEKAMKSQRLINDRIKNYSSF